MNIINSVWHYIDKYYISGIVHDSAYNPVDTVTYAIALGISLFGIIKLLDKFQVKVDTKFIISVIPFIIAGSSLRVLEDMKVFSQPLNYIFVTPLIYFLMFAVTISILILSLNLERKGLIKNYRSFFFYSGAALAIINIGWMLNFGEIRNPYPAAVIAALGIVSTIVVYLISYLLHFKLLTDRLNISILFTHLLDASSTFIGMDWLNYYEKHVAPTFFIELAGNFTDHPSLVMYPLKLLVFIPVLYILDNKIEDENEKKLISILKLAILVLGLSPALRNTFRILMGV